MCNDGAQVTWSSNLQVKLDDQRASKQKRVGQVRVGSEYFGIDMYLLVWMVLCCEFEIGLFNLLGRGLMLVA